MLGRLSLLLLLISFGCREPGGVAVDGGADADATVQADSSTPGLRIATLNLHCLLEEWDRRVPMIVAELAELDPDVIALQEVCREEGGRDALPDLITRLEAATGATYEFSRAETHLAWDVYQEGIALLTRHSFDQVETIDLPVGIFPRKAIVGKISHDAAVVVIAVTHLSFGDQGSVRVNQLSFLRDHMESAGVNGSTQLIVGDLNEGPTGDAIVATTAAGYEDAWATLHPNNDGPTYPVNAPSSRLDYVLLSAPGDAVRARQVQRFLETSVDGLYPSDHLGVWADLGPVD